ncbi:MAG: thiol-disulfide oxidoreductase DCC family protein [Bdellovibrionales bacterium]
MEDTKNKTKLYYDGNCVVCSLEMDHYRKIDKDCNLEMVDISSTDFDPGSVPPDEAYLNKYFHIQRPDGSWVTGVEAFVEIWKTLPYWNKLVPLAKFGPFKLLLNLGYKIFIEVRPYLPKKRKT